MVSATTSDATASGDHDVHRRQPHLRADGPPSIVTEDTDDAGLDHSPVTTREIYGWNIFGFATEGYAGLGTAVFFPLILQDLADSQGYDDNSITNGTSIPCDSSIKNYSCSVKVGSLSINTTSFVFYCTTISVLIQFIVFLGLGALADHGDRRKTFLIATSMLTAGMGLCMLFVIRSDLLWLASLIFILSNVTFGASYVFYYAWVPLLTRYHPDVIKAREDKLSFRQYNAVSDATSNYISSRGFMYGYIGAVVVLIIGSGIVILMGDVSGYGLPRAYPLMVGVAFASLWTFVFLYFPIRWLKPRPGPPLPAGENYLLYSFKKFGQTFAKARQLSNLFLFLIAWFLYSDGFATITAVAILYFKTQLHVPEQHLLLAAIITALFGGIGSYLWAVIQRQAGLSTKTTLLIQATMYSLLCVYGLIGFLTKPGTWGLQSAIEVFPLAAYHGFLLGGTQSSCRVMFSELLPPGYESEFFSLYEITDKGSSWIGPLATALIGDATGNQRNTFYFLLSMMVLPMWLFWIIDIEKGKNQAHEFIIAEQLGKPVAIDHENPETSLDGLKKH